MPDQSTQFLNPRGILEQVGIQAGMRIGDLGCGTGYMSFAASPMVGAKGRIYAVDVQKDVIAQVKKEALMENIGNVETVWSNLEIIGATKVPPESLDLALFVNVLFQINDKKPVFGEARRLLKPGGALLVVDWKQGDTSIGPPAERRLDLADVSKIAAETGFVEIGAINAGQYHFGKLFKKA